MYLYRAGGGTTDKIGDQGWWGRGGRPRETQPGLCISDLGDGGPRETLGRREQGRCTFSSSPSRRRPHKVLHLANPPSPLTPDTRASETFQGLCT